MQRQQITGSLGVNTPAKNVAGFSARNSMSFGDNTSPSIVLGERIIEESARGERMLEWKNLGDNTSVHKLFGVRMLAVNAVGDLDLNWELAVKYTSGRPTRTVSAIARGLRMFGAKATGLSTFICFKATTNDQSLMSTMSLSVNSILDLPT